MASQAFFSKLKIFWLQFWGILFFIAVTINFVEIICRTFFHFSIDLMYDLPIWLTIWAVMMLAGPILPDGDHVSVDMLRDHLSGLPRKIFEILNSLMCILFGVVITISGIIITSQYYDFNIKFIRSTPIPRWVVELCVPLGMLMFTFFACVQLITVLRTKYDKQVAKEEEY